MKGENLAINLGFQSGNELKWHGNTYIQTVCTVEISIVIYNYLIMA